MCLDESGTSGRQPLVLISIAMLSVAAAIGSPAFGQERREVRVGVVFDGPVSSGADRIGMIETELLELTRQEFDVRFPEDLRRQGNWEPAAIRNAIDALLQDPDADVVLAIGPYATFDACHRGDLPKPVIGAGGVDAGAQGFPFRFDDNGRRISGVGNLNYVSWTGIIGGDLRQFHRIVPFDTVHIVFDPLALEIIPGLFDHIRAETGDLEIRIEPVAATAAAAEVLGALPAAAEAVYLLPLFRMPPPEFGRLTGGFLERKIPTFSLLGVSDVERGILAGTAAKEDRLRLARRIALNIQRILIGDDPGTLPVDIRRTEVLTINMATARAIGYHPTWQTLTRAVLLNGEEEAAAGPVLSLSDAVHAAVAANVDLQALRRFVAAGEDSIREAKSQYRPQLDAAVGGRRIDDDRARFGFGLNAEDLGSGSLTLSQLVYSDKVMANVEISKDEQESLVYSSDTLRLDVALQASVAYLDLLRTGTRERILRDNLRLTESNLEIARRRLETGVANPGEVYRWESALATDRSGLIAAQRSIDINLTTFNRILNRPQEQRFVAEDPKLDDPELITGNDRLLGLLDNPWSFERFREFMVGEGLARSPELKALDAAIAAEQRTLTAARRTFYAPDVSFYGGLEQQFYRGGVGSDPVPLPGFLNPDRTNWVLGLEATLPLYAGGERSARAARSLETLNGLKLNRTATAQQVELRIRNSLFRASASFTNIALSAEAAAAAGKNLELTTSQYRQGLVSIIDLLDAQNAALVSDQDAANAVYDFLIDLMGVQRAANNFDFFSSEAEREAWFQRVRRFIEESEPGGDAGGGVPE